MGEHTPLAMEATPQDPVGTLLSMAQGSVLGGATRGPVGTHLFHITEEAEETETKNGEPEWVALNQNLFFLINNLLEAMFYF